MLASTRPAVKPCGHGIAVIELAEFGGVERDAALDLAVDPHGHLPVLDLGDGAEIPICDFKVFIRRGELDAVARGELAFCLFEDVHAAESSRVVRNALPVRLLNGDGFRLAFPTGAYYTWNGTALEGSPIEPDVVVDFSWQDRRNGVDGQLQKALELIDG
jgi:hypothetical protein